MRVRGDWNPMAQRVGNAPALPLAHESAELTQRWEALCERITRMFVRRANYAKIGQTTHKEGETVTEFRTRFEQVFMANSGIPQDAAEDGPYQQQLKYAFQLHET